MCKYVPTGVKRHVEARGRQQMSFLSSSIALHLTFLRKGLSSNLQLTILARLADQELQKSAMSTFPVPQTLGLQAHMAIPSLYVDAGISNQILWLLKQALIH